MDITQAFNLFMYLINHVIPTPFFIEWIFINLILASIVLVYRLASIGDF